MSLTRKGVVCDHLESLEWQESHSLPIRLALIWASVAIVRFKYYFVWGISESALIFSGMGFKRYSHDGKPLWNRYINSHIRGVELNPSLADTPRHWNICTGLWLRHYVYERLTPPHKKPSFLNMIATQLVAGIWHGVFAGYWLFFATSAFMFQASRLMYQYEQNWPVRVREFLPWKLMKIVGTALILDYAGTSFIVLSFKNSWTVWKGVYFFGHVIVFAILLVGAVMPPKRKQQHHHKVEAEHAAGPGPEEKTYLKNGVIIPPESSVAKEKDL
jgi:lysophospholipid acyltransferase